MDRVENRPNPEVAMICARPLALLLALLPLRPCSSQGIAAGPPVSIQVETITHSKFTGSIDPGMGMGQGVGAQINCEFGVLVIDPEKIQEIRLVQPVKNPSPEVFKAPGGGVFSGEVFVGEVITVAGKTIPGEILIPDWRVSTDMGPLLLVPGKVRSITFLRPQSKGQPLSPPSESNGPQGNQPSQGIEPRSGQANGVPDPPSATEVRPAPIPGFLTSPGG